MAADGAGTSASGSAAVGTSAAGGGGSGSGSGGGGGGFGGLTEKELGEKLIESGTKLIDPPSATNVLLTQLDDLESNLSNVSQAPRQYLQDCLLPAMQALIAPKLLRHTDTDVKASVAVCINEITRITAPDAPFNDNQMKECFQLTITALEKLSHSSSRSYIKAITILETIARVRSCLMMLDLECDALVVEMFQLFLNIIRSNHPNPVFENMETIMTMLIKENEDICLNLLTTLLDSVKKENQNVLPMALMLGEKVIKNCAAKLKPYFMEAIGSVGIDLKDYVPLVSSICNNLSDELEPNHVITCEEQRVDVASVLSSDVRAVETCAGLECSRNATPNNDNEAFASSVGATQINDHEVLDGKDVAQNNDIEASADKKSLQSLARCSESKPPESSNAIQTNEYDNREIVNSVKFETEPERVLRKRGFRPNFSMNPDEGYEHYWMGGGTSDPKSPRRRKNDKARVNPDSFSKTVSKEEKTLSTDLKDNAALVVEPEEPQNGTIGASPTGNRSLPDGGLLNRRKKKRSLTAQQDAEISQSVTIVTTEKSQSGSIVSSEKTESGSMVPREQSQSVSTASGSLQNSSIPKKSTEIQHDTETSQRVAVVLPPKTQNVTDTLLEKSLSGTISPNSSLPEGIRPKKRSKKKESIMTQSDDKISETVTIVLPEESQSGTISLNSGPPDGSQPKRRKNKGSMMTGKDVETSQTVTIILPKNSQSVAIGASAIPEGSIISDGSLLKMKRKKNEGSVKDSPSAKKNRLVSTGVEDKAAETPLQRYAESQLTSPEVSRTVTTQSTPTPNCNKLPAEKVAHSKKKSTLSHQNAIENCPSVAIGASAIPDGNILHGSLLKTKGKKKRSSVTQQDADIDSSSAKKKHLVTTQIEDKAVEPPLQKHAELQLTSPEVSQTAITQSRPTPNKLPAEKSKKPKKSKKKSTVMQSSADENCSSVPKECPSSSHVRCEPTRDAIATVKVEPCETETLVHKPKKKLRHSQKITGSGKTTEETVLAPQVAVLKEGGQSEHEEKPLILSIMNESPKNTCGKGSSAIVKKRGRPKKAAAEKNIGDSTPNSSIKSDLDVNLKKETKRKLTPAIKVHRKPRTVEEARGLVGKRIKVWWPRDKTFYDGIVDAYDYFREKHRIIYTDGEEEVLNLRTQVWELSEENDKTSPEKGAHNDQGSTEMHVKEEMANESMESYKSTMKEKSGSSSKRVETSAVNPDATPNTNVSESCGLQTLSNVADEEAKAS